VQQVTENGDTASLNYPAAFDCVVGVGMTDKNGIVGSLSKNSSVYVVAPGILFPDWEILHLMHM
jgi:subtilisin family serine protease